MVSNRSSRYYAAFTRGSRASRPRPCSLLLFGTRALARHFNCCTSRAHPSTAMQATGVGTSVAEAAVSCATYSWGSTVIERSLLRREAPPDQRGRCVARVTRQTLLPSDHSCRETATHSPPGDGQACGSRTAKQHADNATRCQCIAVCLGSAWAKSRTRHQLAVPAPHVSQGRAGRLSAHDAVAVGLGGRGSCRHHRAGNKACVSTA